MARARYLVDMSTGRGNNCVLSSYVLTLQIGRKHLYLNYRFAALMCIPVYRWPAQVCIYFILYCRSAAQRQSSGLAFGFQGLAQGVTSGLTGIYRSPVAGYGSGSSSGLALGLGRGLLGVVGLPLSGALSLVSSVSAGIASSTGVTYTPKRGAAAILQGKHIQPGVIDTQNTYRKCTYRGLSQLQESIALRNA